MIVAIANQKGGVGKTTTAVNLAAALAASGNRVLLIDLDPQGNATSGLGFSRGSIDQGIYQALVEGLSFRELTQLTPVNNLFLIPSTVDLAGAEIELVGLQKREWRLAEALTLVKDRYSYIVIDCPPSLGLLTINALCAAQKIITPIQCEYYALEGLSQIFQTIQKVQAAWNPGLQLDGILLTMVDTRTNLSQQVEGEVRTHFPGKVYKTTIPRNIRLSEAPSHGLPILLYDPSSKGAASYTLLAKEFLKKQKAPDTVQKSKYEV